MVASHIVALEQLKSLCIDPSDEVLYCLHIKYLCFDTLAKKIRILTLKYRDCLHDYRCCKTKLWKVIGK